MVGSKSGVVTLLKKKIPHVFHIGCISNSLYLIIKSALKCIPEDVEKLLRNILNFLKSVKRQSNFKQIQSIFVVSDHTILRLSDIRWLSFESVAERVLDQWLVLEEYFKQVQVTEK